MHRLQTRASQGKPHTKHVHLSDVGLRFDHMVVFLDISDIQDEAEWYDMKDGRVIWIRGPSPIIPAMREFLYEYTTIPRNLWSLGRTFHKKVLQDPDARRTEEDEFYAINDYRAIRGDRAIETRMDCS